MRPLILTARMDGAAQEDFNALRQRHFPAERNYLDAHLTLFHALPGGKRGEIEALLEAVAGRHGCIEARVEGLRSLGRGVAFAVESSELVEIRAGLVTRWREFLTVQDRQKWRPHITVQNKVTPAAASALLEELRRGFTPREMRFEGLELWHYADGPWEPARSFAFVAGE